MNKERKTIFLARTMISLLPLIVCLVVFTVFVQEMLPSSHSLGSTAILYKALPWTELIYYLTGPALVVIALYGLNQLTISKRDIEVRNERASKEKALEYASRFATIALPLGVLCQEKVRWVWPPCIVSDFTPSSLPESTVESADTILSDPESQLAVINILNELQTISSAFYTGVADEETGFKIMGVAYCTAVQRYYPFICAMRKDLSNPLWHFIVELDGIWRGRQKKNSLELSQKEISKQISSVPNKVGATIGQDKY